MRIHKTRECKGGREGEETGRQRAHCGQQRRRGCQAMPTRGGNKARKSPGTVSAVGARASDCEPIMGNLGITLSGQSFSETQ